jgi:glycosyltransferase involved in cell wall biosynthesis
VDLKVPVGAVVIGRNEGERLRRCLQTIDPTAAKVVYVDSGSTDGSAALARQMGVDVLELDTTIPLCAARARNEGYARLTSIHRGLQFVQFVDGDCELTGDWLTVAVTALREGPKLAIVAGWLRERQPERSVFNRLGDLEWNFAGVGVVDSVGGIFMVRCEAFSGVGGFDPTLSAGEEAVLCQRLRAKGWRVVRLDHDMAWHDLAMTRFGQWWRRVIRFGYASMDVATRFGLPEARRNNWRARVWTVWLIVTVVAALLAATSAGSTAGATVALVLSGLWPAQVCRIAFRTWRKGQSPTLSATYALFVMLSLWPQFLGQMLFLLDRRGKRTFRLIEYKGPSGASTRT